MPLLAPLPAPARRAEDAVAAHESDGVSDGAAPTPAPPGTDTAAGDMRQPDPDPALARPGSCSAANGGAAASAARNGAYNSFNSTGLVTNPRQPNAWRHFDTAGGTSPWLAAACPCNRSNAARMAHLTDAGSALDITSGCTGFASISVAPPTSFTPRSSAGCTRCNTPIMLQSMAAQSTSPDATMRREFACPPLRTALEKKGGAPGAANPASASHSGRTWNPDNDDLSFTATTRPASCLPSTTSESARTTKWEWYTGAEPRLVPALGLLDAREGQCGGGYRSSGAATSSHSSSAPTNDGEHIKTMSAGR